MPVQVWKHLALSYSFGSYVRKINVVYGYAVLIILYHNTNLFYNPVYNTYLILVGTKQSEPELICNLIDEAQLAQCLLA